MEPFRQVDAVALPIARANVDTDQIVPARYLQRPRSDDFGPYLFRDLRFDADGGERAAFPLNLPEYRPARIIVADRNFGCGSSREHAVWALCDYGFRVAIAPSFGDIFASNAQRNGFLTIVLPPAVVADLLAQLDATPGAHVAIDLPQQTVTAPNRATHPFAIDPYAKRCLLEGQDEIAATLARLDAIEAFEARRDRDAW
jgi:3-isopropylmalate/(R)-2-methylmalate dehydratase small subunit